MKTILLQNLIVLLLSVSMLQAQELIIIKHSCSFDEEETDQEFYYFGASSEADKIVAQIVDAVSLSKNFVVKSSDCKNALATVENGKRFILYNTSFLERFKKDARTKWAAYCVLAHEIGHHLNGHDFKTENSKLRKQMELQADIFAGGVLHKLGATLDEAKAGIELLQQKGGSDTHPPARARAEAIANGWKKSEENAERLNPTPITKRKEENTSTNNTRTTAEREEDKSIPIPDTGFNPSQPKKNLTTVSDQLIINNLIGTWQLDLGYNAYGQYVIVQSGMYADGTMSTQTFFNGVVGSTEYLVWGVSNNVLAVLDQAGYFYYYTPSFNGGNVAIMTFTGSTGASAIAVGTQLYYTRIR